MNTLVVKSAVDLVTHFIERKLLAYSAPAPETEVKVDRHLREALNWSRRIQFLGMARAEETEKATIALRLAAEPRRFRGLRTAVNRTEIDLLNDDRNYILLGDPGAGKTTTLKRVVQRLLLEEPVASSDCYQFPVILRLRDLDSSETLVRAIAKALGIPFHLRRKPSDDPTREDKEEWYPGFWLGKTPLEDAIAEFLNVSQAVLLLDGLDEVHSAIQERVRRELAWLALNTNGAKIVVSCRTGDYNSVIDGFDLMEICPLEAPEITAIAASWLGDPESFIAELSRVPYADIADRPLLLTQLLFLYKRYGYLPDQPSQVYRKVVALLLQEWDAERGISRQSKYSHFDPDRKASFLAAMAYYLTFKIQKKTFYETDLLDAYHNIHDRFRLPASESKQVISEIQTHTGIVAVAGYDTYEFSHLSLQEYLCADYLIREPSSEYLNEYLAQYPAPVAIAVALSSNPSATFAALFLRSKHVKLEGVNSLLSRLVLEHPFFDTSAALGVAIMKLYHDFSSTDLTNLENLISLPSVRESIALAFTYFTPGLHVNKSSGNFICLHRIGAVAQELRGFRFPEQVYLPAALLEDLYIRGNPHAAALQTKIRNATI